MIEDKNLINRFLKKTQWNGKCLLWIGGKTKRGYGRFKINGILYGAHHISYQIYINDIPEGDWILHKCDNPSCVNPIHLFNGDRSDNMKDCVLKNRHNFQNKNKAQSGETHPKAKLKNKNIPEIKRLKSLGISDEEIGKKFGVVRSAIHKISNGINWKDF